MPHTLIEHVDQPFDPTLPFYVPGPLGTPAWRFASGHITGDGSVESWTDDIAGREATRRAGNVTAPRINFMGMTGYPVVQLGSSSIIGAGGAGGISASSGTIYFVFTPSPSGTDTRRTLIDLGGAFIRLESDNRIRLVGSGGSVQTSTDPITTQQRYAVAVWWSAGSWGCKYQGKSGGGTVTFAGVSRTYFGTSTGTSFSGLLFEAIGYSSQHSTTEIDAQLAALESFYGTA